MLAALGQYKILDRIGVGRMGELLRARDTRAGRTVAVRIVADHIAADPERRRRFIDDARAAGGVSHPNIAALFEIGDDQGRLFLVSEFVPGDTLRTLMAGRPLNPRHALDHGIQLADALAEAHSRGLLHGDIRPGTIVITPTGVAKLIDLGFSSWTAGGADRVRAAASLTAMDTPSIAVVPYMSPEQLSGGAQDERSDLFSLGVVLFEMLLGRPPYEGTTLQAVANQILRQDPRAPSAIRGKLPSEFDPIVLRMLARNPDQRCESAATVTAELRAVSAVLDVREDTAERAPAAAAAPGRKMLGPVALAVLAALGALAALAMFW